MENMQFIYYSGRDGTVKGKLSSLTDVLKKTLLFFDGISASDIAPYVHQKMLQDYTLAQVEEKVKLCLKQNPCFIMDEYEMWHLDTKGSKENDSFYKMLLKKNEPMSLRAASKSSSSKKSKTKKLAEEASLLTDGRFVQLDDGNWGLTEWCLEPQQYSLKHLVIKAFKINNFPLTAEQVLKEVQEWRSTTIDAVQQIIKKYPYFERVDENTYQYDPKLHYLHDQMVKRYLVILRRQKQKWQYDRERWSIKVSNLKKQLEEVTAMHREVAAAMAERVSIMDQYHHLSTQLSEKDLLLSMRKKEILRYREQLKKMEAKANSILHQCRLWVKRAREAEAEVENLKKYNDKNQRALETMFTKLQQYKERDRENKSRIAELKDNYTNRIAELQTEIVELKRKLERVQEESEYEERRLYQDINQMSNELKESLENVEELQKSIKLLQQQIERLQEQKKKLENMIRPLPVRLMIKLVSVFR